MLKTIQVTEDALVDALVGSDAYVEHWANKWADLLQVNRKFLGDPGAAAAKPTTAGSSLTSAK